MTVEASPELQQKSHGLVGILEAIQIEGIAFFDTGFVSLHAVPGDTFGFPDHGEQGR